MLQWITGEFEKYRNIENAQQMERYMKDHFPFFGIKSPERRRITSLFFKETGLHKQPFNSDFLIELWEKEEREYQYLALDYIDKQLKNISKEHLSLMHQLITTKSWWDTVDMLAQKPIGKIAEDSPSIINSTIDNWSQNENMWLRRTAILFQLKYKEKTNEDLLYTYIKRNSDSKELILYSKGNRMGTARILKN